MTWNDQDKDIFHAGVDEYTGFARIEYCKLTGLTRELGTPFARVCVFGWWWLCVALGVLRWASSPFPRGDIYTSEGEQVIFDGELPLLVRVIEWLPISVANSGLSPFSHTSPPPFFSSSWGRRGQCCTRRGRSCGQSRRICASTPARLDPTRTSRATSSGSSSGILCRPLVAADVVAADVVVGVAWSGWRVAGST